MYAIKIRIKFWLLLKTDVHINFPLFFIFELSNKKYLSYIFHKSCVFLYLPSRLYGLTFPMEENNKRIMDVLKEEIKFRGKLKETKGTRKGIKLRS